VGNNNEEENEPRPTAWARRHRNREGLDLSDDDDGLPQVGQAEGDEDDDDFTQTEFVGNPSDEKLLAAVLRAARGPASASSASAGGFAVAPGDLAASDRAVRELLRTRTAAAASSRARSAGPPSAADPRRRRTRSPRRPDAHDSDADGSGQRG
jgi:hypothetical protein